MTWRRDRIIDLATWDRPFVTVSALAVHLECDQRTIIRLIHGGDLDARKVGRQWRIDVASARRTVSRATTLRDIEQHLAASTVQASSVLLRRVPHSGTMPVSSVNILDAANAVVPVATRNLLSLGVHYTMTEPEVLTYHLVSSGGGDPVTILSGAAVLKAVRVFNKGSTAAFVKFHNSGFPPTPGAGVVYTASCQAGMGNPDPRLSGAGRAFSSGLGMTIVADIADAGATPVGAGLVSVEVEYHPA